MDLKIPSETAGVKSAPLRVGDLLGQLRAAGTIEAEVVKLLNQNQLLLNTRLGQILTSNSLNYGAGDRVRLRLDESSGQAVLKVSPAEVKPIRLESRAYPQLERALPPDRPLLARVARVVARHAEVRLGEQTIRLPRQPVLAKNQLLSLQRTTDQRAVEIRPVPDKAIYKAIVKQLLPRQTRARESALVNLVSLARTAPADVKAGSAETQLAKPRPGPEPVSAPGRDSGRATGSAENRPATANNPPDRPPGEPRPPAPATPPAARVTDGAVIENRITPLAPRQTDPASRPARPEAQTKRSAAATESTATRPVDNRIASRGPETRGRPGPEPVSPSPRPRTAMQSAQASPRPAPAARGPVNAAMTREPAAGATVGSGQTKPGTDILSTAVPNPASANPAATGAGPTPTSTLPALQPLLQLVTALAAIDAPQVRKWFEFARLIRPLSNPGQATSGGDIFRLLQPLVEGAGGKPDSMQALAPKSAAVADGEAAPAKTGAQETQLLQLREAASRLVEQSLSQNLLQRATLGIQQETQQPLNLSLALPFIDQQQLRPLYIDLEQRNQARDESDRSWEIRLSFELGDLGCIACHLLLEGNAVAASFYSDNDHTRSRIEMELPHLRRQLASAGFNPGEFHSFAGLPAPAIQPGADEFSESLIDLEA